MKIKSDLYQLYINSNGIKFFYKNKKLHRENGHAIALLEEKIPQKELNLYILSKNPISDKYPMAKGYSLLVDVGKSYLSNTPFFTYTDPSYWIEGKELTKSEFDSYILNKSLQKELSKKEIKIKGIKI